MTTSTTQSLTILLALVAGVGCTKKEEAPAAPLRPVRYMEVASAEAARGRTFSGAAKAGSESFLSFRVAGTVRSLNVKVGDAVKKGQLIAEIDPADYALEVQRARASLAQSQAQERNAVAVYDRTRKLYENQNASKSDLDAARAGSESAKAQVAASQQQLALANRQLGYTKLTAPEDGSIASTHVEANENVTAGQQVVMLASGGHIEVQVAVPEVLISLVKKGQAVSVGFGAIKDRKIPGEVTEVGVAAVGGATAFPVTIRLSGDHEEVRSGMAAEVRFEFEKAAKTNILVPSFAVRNDRDGSFVFVVKKSGEELGKIERRPVKVGEITNDGVEILEGLNSGDLLVTAGVSRISDGQEVKLLARHQQSS